jgi:hypothetical protein
MFCMDDYISKENPVRFIDVLFDKIALEKIGIVNNISTKQKAVDKNNALQKQEMEKYKRR